jgi:hypothetical protein
MPGLEMTVETLADEIRTHFWSREPYRYFELGVVVRNDGPETAEEVSYEIGLPETVMLDFNGAVWNPSHRHEIAGVVYVVWSTLGGFGRYSSVVGGRMIPANWEDQWRETLTVDLKPYVQTIEVLYRLFERADPLSDWLKMEITFEPFAPGL